jgi:CRISPR/Cas system-associated exonuclease Cas4 (RecB family)
VDIKSGKSRSKKHAWQVAAYSVMMTGEEGTLKTGRIVYLGAPFGEKVYKNGRVHRYHERVVTLEEIMEYYQEFSAKLVEYVKKIDEAYPLDPDAEDCGDCFFCPFKNHCYGTEYSGARQTEEGY